MERSSRIEDRFQKAALSVCQRWRCLDFRSEDQRFNSSADVFKNDIETLGSVEAARSLLRSEALSEVSVELWARHRLDLTIEALCLRPAWSELFSGGERGTAARRLTDALALESSGALVPPSGADLTSTTAWLNEQLTSWEHDTSLPRIVQLDNADVSVRELGWCDCVAECARELEELGCLRASLEQCSHYRACAACAARWPQLDQSLGRFEERIFASCREVLKALHACLDRVGIPPVRHALDPVELDALAWRAIIWGAGAFEQPFVYDVHRALLSAKSDDPALNRRLSGLSADEVFALHFAEAATMLFIEMQWSLFDKDGPIYLPADGDLSPIPEILFILPSSDFGQWKSLMTGSDLRFEQFAADGTNKRSTSIEGYGLFLVLTRVAAFQQNVRHTAPRSLPKDVPAARQVSDFEAALRTHSDRLSALGDSIDSLRARMDGPSRYRAEESLRKALGDATYSGLCPGARDAAIVAEYCWLDTNFPDPSKIVVELATGFERQLRDVILKSFCDALVASDARNYPESDGVGAAAPGPPGTPVPGRPSLPALLRGGRMNPRLNLGDMMHLIGRPLPALSTFLNERGLNAGRLAELRPDLREDRELKSRVHSGN